MNILADASLSGLTQAFPAPFKLSFYHCNKDVPSLLKGQDVLLCRATLKVNECLLKDHSLQYVATASSGSDHLDHDYLALRGIIALDAKGCNAFAVADYVLSSIAHLRVNHSWKGRRIGIIGMGHVGTQVALRLPYLGFEIVCFDPLKALQNAAFTSCSEEMLYDCDLLCLHAQLHDPPPYASRNMIDTHFLNQLNPDCIILNAARGELVDEQALLQSPVRYCTDVYQHEPQINKEIIAKAMLCTPHIAGHSIEAKWNAVMLISQQLHTLLRWPHPHYIMPENACPIMLQCVDWEKIALTSYNPINETLRLKQATDISQEFIALRQQHNKRHNLLWALNES